MLIRKEEKKDLNYNRLGFEKAENYKVKYSFDVPEEVFMVFELETEIVKERMTEHGEEFLI